MKIIKAGTPKAWSIVTICSGKGNRDDGCGAELEVEFDDLLHTYTSCMGRDETHYVSFKCACCNTYTDIPDKNIPLYVGREIMKKPIHVPKWD